MNFFNKLFNKSKSKNPEDDYTITITKEYIKVEHPQRKTEQVLWENILQIKVINTDEGPWLPDVWLALLGKDDGCLIPQGAKGFDEVYDIVSKYDGFNFENFTKSMSCTDNAEFDLWSKNYTQQSEDRIPSNHNFEKTTELEVLILLLVDKHPSLKSIYSLTRFFAKSSLLPDKLYKTLDGLVNSTHLAVVNPGEQIKSYQVTNLGRTVLKSVSAFDFTETFALKIDASGYIAKITFLLTYKECLVEIINAFKLSNDMIIAFIESSDGRLPDFTILENHQRRKWKIKRYVQTTNSIDGYEKIREQETKNIFQYELESINCKYKPVIGEFLRTTKL